MMNPKNNVDHDRRLEGHQGRRLHRSVRRGRPHEARLRAVPAAAVERQRQRADLARAHARRSTTTTRAASTRRPTTRRRSAAARTSSCRGNAAARCASRRIPTTSSASRRSREVDLQDHPRRNTLATQVADARARPRLEPAGRRSTTGCRAMPGRHRRSRRSIYIFDHIDFNLRRPMFPDVRVRRALTYAHRPRRRCSKRCGTAGRAAATRSSTRRCSPTRTTRAS